jgi:biotin carboxyl carrier protein
MNDYDWILSPCQGVVEEILISERCRFNERDTLFKIRTNQEEIEIVSTAIPGVVQSLEVREGEKVYAGMVIAFIEEDLVSEGSG